MNKPLSPLRNKFPPTKINKNPTAIPGSECLWLRKLPLPYPAYLWLISTRQVQIQAQIRTNLGLRAICQLASDDLRQHWPRPKANQKLQLNWATEWWGLWVPEGYEWGKSRGPGRFTPRYASNSGTGTRTRI